MINSKFYVEPPLEEGTKINKRPIVARLKGNRPTIGRLYSFVTFKGKSVRIVFNVIASVGRQIDVYRPIKIQKSYRPTVFLM